jgi:hypothetical protein
MVQALRLKGLTLRAGGIVDATVKERSSGRSIAEPRIGSWNAVAKAMRSGFAGCQVPMFPSNSATASAARWFPRRSVTNR